MAAFFSSCIDDAPADNPLDPVHGTRLIGSVQRFYTNDAIPGALVFLRPGNRVALSDDLGNFVLDGVPLGTYTVFCEAEGFRNDSLSITIEESRRQDFRLDALPAIYDVQLTTHRIASFNDDPDFVQIEVIADDPDNTGDIEWVTYEIADLGIVDTLFQESPDNNLFFGTLELAMLDTLIGRPFSIQVEDKPGAIVRSENHIISRVITNTPTTLSPRDSSVSNPFRLTWESINVAFPFSYDIEIWLNNFGFFTLAATLSDIPQDSTGITFEGPLDSGNYFWLLYLVDEFGNRSRSLEKQFRFINN